MPKGKSVIIEDEHAKIPIDMVPIPLHYREDVEYVMIPHGFIMDRTEALANEIFEDHGDEPLVCLCVLNGGYRFFNDLTFRIQSKNRNSSSQSIPITVDFIRFKSYKNTESVGEPQLIGHCDLGYIKGKNVLVIEDIVDTGKTMVKLLDTIGKFEPKQVKVCCLLTKRTPLWNGYVPDYTGFEVPNRYVVGYAFDVNGHFRDMDHISIFKPHALKKYGKE